MLQSVPNELSDKSWIVNDGSRHNVGKQIEDHWNVDGERELSDAWTGFTRFILLNERPPDGYTWSRERLTRKPTTSRPDDS